MIDPFTEIKRLRERVGLDDAASIHLLAVQYMNDYASVCMSAMLKSICVAFYKLAYSTLTNMGGEHLVQLLDILKDSPKAKTIGEVQKALLLEAAKKGVDFQREVYRSLSAIYSKMSDLLNTIISDKWGDDFRLSKEMKAGLEIFKSSPKFSTLLESLNSFAREIKKIDFRTSGINALQKNANAGYLPSKLILDCIKGKSKPAKGSGEKSYLPDLPNILFISFGQKEIEVTESRKLLYYEYTELINDILKEICLNFADSIDVESLPLNIITDFAKENSVAYEVILCQVESIAHRLISESSLEDEAKIDLPPEYIKWLIYHNDASFKEIGEQLDSGKLSINLTLRELFQEYIKSKVRRYIADKIKEGVDYFTIIGVDARDSLLAKEIQSLKTNLNYCVWGSPENDYVLANLFLRGEGVEKDIERGIILLRYASDNGYAPAQYQLGLYLLEGTYIETDKAKAVHYLTLASDQSLPTAQYELGKILMHEGNGGSSDTSKALDLLVKAEEQGNEKARIELCKRYLNGDGVEQSNPQFAEYVTKFYGSSNGEALYLLAEALYNGIGLEKNVESAIKIYTISASAGEIRAQLRLGDTYGKGSFGPVNLEEAKKWYKFAADQNSAEAQCALVKLGHQMLDESMSVEYFIKAAQNGQSEIFEDEIMRYFPDELLSKWKSQIKVS